MSHELIAELKQARSKDESEQDKNLEDEILNDIAGLLLRDRLSILSVAEICLWNDRIITQDELDVLELLYWRLGFQTEDIIDEMQKKNSLIIV